MSAHPTQDRIEAAYPGYFVMAGPFMINHLFAEVAEEQQAACRRVYKAQRKVCPHTKIITHGEKNSKGAWVLRKLPPVAIGPNARFRFKSGICADPGGASKRRITRSQQKVTYAPLPISPR